MCCMYLYPSCCMDLYGVAWACIQPHAALQLFLIVERTTTASALVCAYKKVNYCKGCISLPLLVCHCSLQKYGIPYMWCAILQVWPFSMSAQSGSTRMHQMRLHVCTLLHTRTRTYTQADRNPPLPPPRPVGSVFAGAHRWMGAGLGAIGAAGAGGKKLP